VELALEREDIGPAFREFVVQRLGREDPSYRNDLTS